MTKKLQKRLIIITLVLCIPLLIYIVNKAASAYYDSHYTDADKGAYTPNYSLTSLKIEGKIQYHFGERDVTETKDTILGPGYDGRLLYDTLSRNIIFQTEECVKQQGSYTNETITRTFAITPKGNINELDSIPKNVTHIKNQLPPFYKWKDRSQLIFMEHFAKQDFDYGALNPLRGMGNPTGGRPTYWWDGMGYYKIKFKNDTFKVKLPCESEAMFFSSEYEYYTGLDYYILPEQDIAFLIYSKTFDKDHIYIIKRKH